MSSDTHTTAWPVLIDPDKALEMVLAHPILSRVEILPLEQVFGRVLAEAIVADRDYPPFDRAMMDGFAARLTDQGKVAELVGEIGAGDDSTLFIEDGQVCRIMTGAVCPPGTQVVVPVEQVEQTAQGIRLPDNLKSGKHITPQGNECSRGTDVLQARDALTPLAIATLATCGHTQARVYAPPRVTLMSTGKELVEYDTDPARHQIRDSNTPMLSALLAGYNVKPRVMAAVVDSLDILKGQLQAALEDKPDILILTGGVSAGKFDLVPDALQQIGAEIQFHKVTQKPGKPLLFARYRDTSIFGLPGNPLSAHLCCHRYILPVIRRSMGLPVQVPSGQATITHTIKADARRTSFVLVEVVEGHIIPVRPLGSADIFAPIHANAYCRIEVGTKSLEPDEVVSFEWIRRIQ